MSYRLSVCNEIEWFIRQIMLSHYLFNRFPMLLNYNLSCPVYSCFKLINQNSPNNNWTPAIVDIPLNPISQMLIW